MNNGGYDIYTITCTDEVFIYSYNNSLDGKNNHIIISRRHDNFGYLIDHLEHLQGQIGWDNINYDYQILHSVILARNGLKLAHNNDICTLLYNISLTIDLDDYVQIKDVDYLIPQYDMKSLLGFDKTNWPEVARRLDIPIEKSDGTLEGILKENASKLDIIKNIYKIVSGYSFLPSYSGHNLLATRKYFFSKYGIRCANSSNIKLGEQFILKRYRQLTNGQIPSPEKTVSYDVKSYLPSFIKNLKNEDAVAYFKRLSEMPPSNKCPEFNGVIQYNNIVLQLSNGSIKGASEAGIYNCNENELFVYYDITSEFPSIIVNQSLHPQHLSNAFVAAMAELLQLRFKAIEEHKDVYIDTIKKMLVSIYGKLGEEKSLLYDKSVQINVCIYAQAFMCYLIEQILSISNDIEFIFVNTDGLMFKLNQKHVNVVDQKVQQLMQLFKFKFKKHIYNQIYLYDVNNYAATSPFDMEVKGIFDARMTLFKNYHQRKAAEIVYDYFVNGVDNTSISDYDDKSKKLAIAAILKVSHRNYTLF